MKRFRDDVLEQIHAAPRGSADITDIEFRNAVEGVIDEKRLPDGETVIDRFVRETPDLSARDAEIVLGWRDSIIGVFRLEQSNGPVADAVNLVDGLEYRLVANNDTREIRRALSGRGFIISRIVSLLDAWMFSGGQTLLPASEKRAAYGLAAKMALKSPRLFFRNPGNLENALDSEKKKHHRFVRHFGAPWIMGAPEQIEHRWREFMLPDVEDSNAEKSNEMFCLPPSLQKAETVGMVHDPREGFYFLRDFGVFMDALRFPEKARERKAREVLLGYLEEPGVSPAIFSLAAVERPDQLNALLATLLDRPGFDWARDGEECLREHNPGFLDQPRFPSTLSLNDNMVDGLRFVNERAARDPDYSVQEGKTDLFGDDDLSHPTDTLPRRPSRAARNKARAKRKLARKARKRNRK